MFPTPPAGAGEVRIDLVAAALNRRDPWVSPDWTSPASPDRSGLGTVQGSVWA